MEALAISTVNEIPSGASLSDEDLNHISDELGSKTAEERLGWAVKTYGETLLFTSSFGAGSAVLLSMWSELAPGLPVVFLDTGFLFDETLRYRDELTERLHLNLKVLHPEQPTKRFLQLYGQDIQKKNPDFCCAHNKVAPLQTELKNKRAWVSGLRRDQSHTRKDVGVVQPSVGGPAKVHPIADWTARDVYVYLKKWGLPEHPLLEQGYMSVGCAPCTKPIGEGDAERDGRWAGSGKTECGLHTFLKTAS